MKIAKKVKNDKRSKTIVNATVHKTKIKLKIGNIEILLGRVQAERAHRTLGRALMIQDTKKKNRR